MIPGLLSMVVPPGGSSVEATPLIVLAAAGGMALVSIVASLCYGRIHSELARVGRALAAPPTGNLTRSSAGDRGEFLPENATAVLLVEDYDAPGMHSLLEIVRMFPGAFTQIVFVTARAFDTTDVERREEGQRLEKFVEASLARFLPVAELIEMKGAVRVAIGPDPVGLTIAACEAVARTSPKVFLFWTRPEIAPPKWHHRLFTNKTSEVVARILLRRGWITLDVALPVIMRSSLGPKSRIKCA